MVEENNHSNTEENNHSNTEENNHSNTEENNHLKTEENRMPFWEHLDELRTRLIKCLVAVVVGLLVVWSFSEYLIRFLESPLLDILPADQSKLYFTGLTDKFFTYFKVSALASVALVFPYLLYQLWCFVAPGLFRHERRMVLPFVFMGALAFLLGMVFAFTVVIPFGYKFLIDFGSPTEIPIITITEYFDLTLKLLLGLGLVFELPVVMVLFALLGVLDAKTLSKYRRHAFLIIAILSAIITPTPDAFTMVLVMGPLWLLYEISVIAARWVKGRSAKTVFQG